MRHSEIACVVAVNDDGKILAASRGGFAQSNVGLWEFPGGKPLAGESFSDCAIRRFSEELNLQIEIAVELKCFTTKFADKEISVHPFIAKIVGGEPRLITHSRAEWFAPGQLLSLAWPSTDTPIIEQLIDRFMSIGRIL